MITLAIIGVVAAVTMPILIANIQEHILKTKWRKAYADLSQALEQVKAEEDINYYFNCSTNYCSNDLVPKILNKFAKIEKESEAVSEQAFRLYYKSYSGVTLGKNVFSNGIKYKTKDYDIYYWSFYTRGLSIWVDVNGLNKGPNVLGKDLFVLEVRNYKINPAYNQYETVAECKMSNKYNLPQFEYVQSHTNVDGVTCSAKYIYEK